MWALHSKRTQLLTLLLLSTSFLPTESSHAQIVFNQTDTFEGGTVSGWVHGVSTPGALSVQTGGPAGASDHYLKVIADGVGDAGNLSTANKVQWKGNFTLTGVNQIEMDLQGFSSPGSSDLAIRIGVRSTSGSAAPGYVSTTPFTLPVDGQWHHATFDLTSMTAVGIAPPSLASVLANVQEFRILQAAAPDLQGDSMVAQLGIDNITAVPEPASAMIMASLLGVLAVVSAGHRRMLRQG